MSTQREMVEAAMDNLTQRLAELGCNSQVVASWKEGTGTAMAHRGRGDWYARKGLMESWVEASREPLLNPQTVRIEDNNT